MHGDVYINWGNGKFPLDNSPSDIFPLPCSKVWPVTITLARRLDAFDSWSLRKILRISYTRHVTNATVRQITGCCPVSHLIHERRLRFFGHVARADFQQDHHRVNEASLQPPSHWRRPCRRPRSTWLRGINSDVQSVNTGIHHSAWSKASDRTLWRRIVHTATLLQGARH